MTLIARQGGEVGRAPFMVVAGRQSEVGTRRGVLVDEPKPKDKPPSLFTAGLVLLSPEPFLQRRVKIKNKMVLR